MKSERDFLKEKNLRDRLGQDFKKETDIFWFRELNSGIDFAKEKIRNEKKINEIIIVSDELKNAKGRYGRAWYAPSGGIWISYVLKINKEKIQDAPLVSHLAGLAINNTINKYLDGCELKWVNDILYDDKKIAGILIEGILNGEDSYLIVGIGINTNVKEFGFSFDHKTLPSYLRSKKLSEIATSVEIETGKKTDNLEMIVQMTEEFSKLHGQFNGGNEIISRYKNACRTIGKRVEVYEFGKLKMTGKAIDVNEKGNLIVETNDGRKKIISEEVFYCDSHGN
jgi:BirA family transcriptional regulator, biotin operon repressor / biotin---[acetyl-CoA-carboxylase] ligase